MLPQFRKQDNEPQKQPSVATAPSLSSPTPVSSLGQRASGSTFRANTGGSPSVIGPDLVIQGNLISKGEVQIEGEVQGDIHGTNIIVGEKAKVTGSILAEECVIRGHVLGTVRGRRVLLQATSHVEGDIHHQTVAIEQGAFFEGKSRRANDPLAVGTATERKPEPTPAAAPAIATPPPLEPGAPSSP